MAKILTSETAARWINTAETGDLEVDLNFNIQTGDAIVINAVDVAITLGATTAANSEVAGTLGLALTIDAQASDIPGFSAADEFDANSMGGPGMFLFMDFAWQIAFAEATESGAITMLPQTAAWDWRALDVDKRPLTTEIMRGLVNVLAVAIGFDLAMTIWYQRVQLEKGDLGILQPGTRIIRFPVIGQTGTAGRVGRIF